MSKNARVTASKSRLDSAFSRIGSVTKENNDMELLSDYARYLCILVSGYIETALYELFGEYCKGKANAQVSNYVTNQLHKLQNINSAKLLQLIGSFNKDWRDKLEKYIEGERKDSLDSVVNLRNQIAHGGSAGITYIRIKDYYRNIGEIMSYIESLIA